MHRILAIILLVVLSSTLRSQNEPECFKGFSTGYLAPGDSVEIYYFIAAVYPNPDSKGVITYLSPVFQVNGRKSDTTWSKRGLGLFRYGIIEFKDSIKNMNLLFDASYQGDYKGIVTRSYNPARRVHSNAFCINELRKVYYKEASKGKDQAVFMDDFVYTLEGHKDKDFDTLVIRKFEGDLSNPALIKEILKQKNQ